MGSLSSLAANLGAVRLQTFVLCCDPKKVYGDKDGASLIDDTNFNLNDNMVSLVMVSGHPFKDKNGRIFKESKDVGAALQAREAVEDFFLSPV